MKMSVAMLYLRRMLDDATGLSSTIWFPHRKNQVGQPTSPPPHTSTITPTVEVRLRLMADFDDSSAIQSQVMQGIWGGGGDTARAPRMGAWAVQGVRMGAWAVKGGYTHIDTHTFTDPHAALNSLRF